MALKRDAVILTKPESVETVLPVVDSPARSDVPQTPPRRASASAPPKMEHGEDDDDDDDHFESWETESVIEGLIDDASPPELSSGAVYRTFLLVSSNMTNSEIDPNGCTPEEVRMYKRMLHEKGLQDFVQETLGKGIISARKLCSAFHVRMPPWFRPNEPDESFYRLLGIALMKELSKRQKISQYKSIDDAAKALQSAKNVVVVTGAGISTSLGIPDFRSKSTGFYSRLREMGFQEPEEVFDLNHFDEDPR
jgi:NAD+-dependent protein deacetylase SIR2